VRASWLSLSRTFPVLLLLGLLGITARSATDPDLWWHLRTGQWIVETGQVPHTDPFSFTRAGQPWVAHEWLSEVIFYEIWKHAGAAGLIVFAALITAAGFMVLYRRCPGEPHWAAAATVLGALASAPTWGVRPQMFTFALASLWLWLLDTGRQRPWRLLWIPPLFLLWLNLHAGFALGPVLLVAFAAGWLWEVAVGETPWREARPVLSRLLLLLLACLVLVPLNPNGARLYRYPLEVLHSAEMRSFIVEWLSPDFHQSRFGPFLLICLLLTIVCAISRFRPQARVLVPLLGTFLAALDAVRHIPIFVLLAVPVISAALPAATSSWRLGPNRPAQAMHTGRMAFHSAILILMAVFAAVRWQTLVRHQAVSEAELFPQRAVEFVRSEGASSNQRLFAYYDWGGYAIWKLYPRKRVFVDGRADLYGNDLIDQFRTAIELRRGWQKVLDEQGVELALIPPSSPLAQALALQAPWVVKYRDPKATVFLRIGPTAGGPRKLSGMASTGQVGEKIFTGAHLNLRN
jgi:hypothetical protein